MTEQAIEKQKTDALSILKRFGAVKAQESVTRTEKEDYYRQLTESIQDAYMEWQSALANFENAEGKDMVDYYAYRIKASQIRYDYLLRKAKESYTN
jgi:hypothetical protein